MENNNRLHAPMHLLKHKKGFLGLLLVILFVLNTISFGINVQTTESRTNKKLIFSSVTTINPINIGSNQYPNLVYLYNRSVYFSDSFGNYILKVDLSTNLTSIRSSEKEVISIQANQTNGSTASLENYVTNGVKSYFIEQYTNDSTYVTSLYEIKPMFGNNSVVNLPSSSIMNCVEDNAILLNGCKIKDMALVGHNLLLLENNNNQTYQQTEIVILNTQTNSIVNKIVLPTSIFYSKFYNDYTNNSILLDYQKNGTVSNSPFISSIPENGFIRYNFSSQSFTFAFELNIAHSVQNFIKSNKSNQNLVVYSDILLLGNRSIEFFLGDAPQYGGFSIVKYAVFSIEPVRTQGDFMLNILMYFVLIALIVILIKFEYLKNLLSTFINESSKT